MGKKSAIGVLAVGIGLLGIYVYMAVRLYGQLHALFYQVDTTAKTYASMGVDLRSVLPEIERIRGSINDWNTRANILRQKQMSTELTTYRRLLDDLLTQEMIVRREELGARLLRARSRLVESTYLDGNVKEKIYLELERVSYTQFDKKTTPLRITQAVLRVAQIEQLMSENEDSNKRAQVEARLREYENRCRSFVDFFSAQNKDEAAQRAQVCVNETSRFASNYYKANSTDYLRTVIEDSISPLVKILEEEKEDLIAAEVARQESQRETETLLSTVPPAQQMNGKVIVIDLLLQRLYAYKDGISVFRSAVPVTTGKNGFETVRGSFEIYDKQSPFRMRSPFPDIYYDNMVEYWMPFFLGYGLHDAPWRGIYGTQDYTSVGSHGCINIPREIMSVLYNWAELHTRVIVL